MFKKVFLTLGIMFSLFLFSSYSFGTNAIMNGANNIGNQINDSAHKAGATADNIVNGAAGTIRSTANTVGAGVTNNNPARTATNNGYTATRTATPARIGGLSTTAWTWFILAATALIIGSLVWYYTASNNTSRRHVDNNDR